MSPTTAKSTVKASSFREFKFALLLVATVGLVGSIYVLSSIQEKDANQTQNLINLPSEPIHTKSNILKVEGKKYSGEELTFTISNFNDKLNYTINFGDDEIHYIDQANFRYRFEEAQSYPIELKIEYQKNVFLLDRQVLVIENPRNSDVNP